MADVTPTPAPAPSTIKKIFQAIWAFINSKFIGYAIALVLIIFIAQTCNNLNKAKQAAANAQQNISALTDTLHKEKLKSGALQFSIDGYISDAKGLKTLNKDLSDELANQKGTVISLNKVVMLLMQDTTDLRKYIDLLKAVKEKPVKVNDTTYFVPWTLPYTYDSTNFDLFKGRTKIGLTLIDKSLTNFNFSNVNVLDEGTELLSRMTQMELVFSLSLSL